jgi:glutamate-ammonia-ligase adenylyltransferase
LGRDGILQQTITHDYLVQHLEIMQSAKPSEDHRNHLLRIQNAAMFQSGVRFLLRLTNIEDMGHELTEVADFVLAQSLPPVNGKLAQRYPAFTEQYANEMVILGLGKLGGKEFNVASDCDIIMIYPESFKTGEVTASEYYHRWGAQYVKYLEDKSAMGFLYHGDARLRPFGGDSPLACTFAAFTDYYRSHAQFWEKMALSRARVVVGNENAERYLQELKEEILFQRAMSREERQMLIEMRHKIEKEKSGETLKAAPGGIIDVEFIAQALVLTHGHALPAIRLTSTLEVLRVACESQLMPQEQINALIDSYTTLREVENRMRIVNNTSIDSLPDDPAELEKLTRRCALKTDDGKYTPGEFVAWVGGHTHTVREIYDAYFLYQ